MRLTHLVAARQPASRPVALPLQVAAAIRDAASGAAAATALTASQVSAAIEGDLIAASPALSTKISEIEGRLADLEPV